jgi:hypothetical protein
MPLLATTNRSSNRPGKMGGRLNKDSNSPPLTIPSSLDETLSPLSGFLHAFHCDESVGSREVGIEKV